MGFVYWVVEMGYCLEMGCKMRYILDMGSTDGLLNGYEYNRLCQGLFRLRLDMRHVCCRDAVWFIHRLHRILI